MADQPDRNALAAALEAERERCRRAEEALRDSEERHRLLVEGARDYAIVLLDPAGHVATWNEGARRLVGYQDGEILGRHFSCLFTAADRQAGRPGWELATAAATGRTADENWTVRPDGSLFWASGVTTARRDEAGRLLGFVKIFRDLTERRRAEEALRQSEWRLRAALGAARMGTWLWNIPADRDSLDENLRQLLGLPEGVAVSTLEDFLRVIHPGDRAAVAEAFGRTAREGVHLNVDFRVVRADGTARWIRDQGDVIAGPDGRPLYLTGACLDITDHKRLEEELRQARDELERRVQERTAELGRAQQQALQAERLATIGQTVAGLAHESRNALQRSQACLERLSWKLQDQPEALDLVQRAQKAQEDLEHLFEDVRGYAAPLKLDRRPCDLAEAWRTAWAELADQRAGRDAQLREESGRADLRCAADAFRLTQVFRNVLENSLAACADPVRIVIDCAETALEGVPAIRVAVGDNGPGLNDEQRRQIFEPFYTTKAKGTGLGMAIAERLVEAHGGLIALGPGPGAEVVLTLPRRSG